MTSADTAFAALAQDYVESSFRANPERATAFGDHRFDAQLRDYSACALDGEKRRLRATLDRLSALDPQALTGPNPADAEILRNAIAEALFELEEERPFATNPLSYEVSLAQGIHLLFARDVLSPRERLRGIAGRLARIPRVLAQAQSNLERPPRVHTETAIQRCPGAIGLIRTDIEPLIAQVPELRAELEPLQARAAAALESHLAWLERDLLPRSDGDFRLGESRFRRKLGFALFSELTPEQIRARAESELESVTAELHQTALAYCRTHQLPAAAEAHDRPAVIRAALARVSERHANDSTLVPRCQEILAAATDFVRRHDLVTLPDAPLSVIMAPVFVRGVSVAYCDPPGALEPSGRTFFAIAPAPESWAEERKRSYYREYCDAMLHDLSVHEAMPGHYVQLARANRFRAPTPVRALFYSGTFVEGWAIWSEKLMAGLGFGGPENKLQQLKMRLRMVINALLDQGIHMGAMTEKEAMDLMLRRGFQEEAEAAGKWRRACLTSTQLSTYFVGAAEFEDLRSAAQKAWGAAFTDKRFHDTATAFGSPPCRLLRQEMGI